MDIARQGNQPGDKGAPVGALTPILEGGAMPGAGVAPVAGAASSVARMSAPMEIHLAGVANGIAGGTVAVTPTSIELLVDPAGPLGQNTVSLANSSSAEQLIWLSYESVVGLIVTVEQPVPSRVTLRVTVDLAYAASFGAQAPKQATIYITTAAQTTPVMVSWRPLPYGRM